MANGWNVDLIDDDGDAIAVHFLDKSEAVERAWAEDERLAKKPNDADSKTFER